MKRPLLALFIALVSMNSCIKKELPVKPHETGDVLVGTVNMDPSYKYQVFYSLSSNSVVSRNLKTAWDIGLETAPDGYHVVLNSAKSMYAMRTGKSDFAAVAASDTAGFAVMKKWDAPHGDMDSTALGDWRESMPVYIVDLGFNEKGQPQGMRKMQLSSVNKERYNIRFASLDGSGDTSMIIAKDTMLNLVSLSLADKQVVMVEPPKNTWDIEFTQYTYIFWDELPVTPYLVTGCLLNRYNTKAVIDSSLVFSEITFGNVGGYKFTNDISTIGYEWKVFNGSTYAINSGNSYVIASQRGAFYKLHFIGFYSSSGAKGNPQWEYQQL